MLYTCGSKAKTAGNERWPYAELVDKRRDHMTPVTCRAAWLLLLLSCMPCPAALPLPAHLSSMPLGTGFSTTTPTR